MNDNDEPEIAQPARYGAGHMLISASLLIALHLCDVAIDRLYKLELWLLRNGGRYT